MAIDPRSRRHFKELKKRFRKHRREAVKKLNAVSSTAVRTAAAGALTSGLLLAAPKVHQIQEPERESPSPETDSQLKLASAGIENPEPARFTQGETQTGNDYRGLSRLLTMALPVKVEPMKKEVRQKVENILNAVLGIRVVAELNGYRLNTNYGYIGAEQHLPRFPGDTASQHDAWQSSGITQRLGAWGYVPTELEKYYFAVQTFKSPNWREDVYGTKEWLKWRKVIAVNPKTGAAVVGVIADSGPASWTGKQFGGSPEVMEALGLHTGPRKGEVVLMFVNDPDDKIPLGPVTRYNASRVNQRGKVTES